MAKSTFATIVGLVASNYKDTTGAEADPPQIKDAVNAAQCETLAKLLTFDDGYAKDEYVSTGSPIPYLMPLPDGFGEALTIVFRSTAADKRRLCREVDFADWNDASEEISARVIPTAAFPICYIDRDDGYVWPLPKPTVADSQAMRILYFPTATDLAADDDTGVLKEKDEKLWSNLATAFLFRIYGINEQHALWLSGWETLIESRERAAGRGKLNRELIAKRQQE